MLIFAQIIFALLIAFYGICLLFEYRYVSSQKKALVRGHLPAASHDAPTLSTVSIFLPIYNEEAVLEKLIASVCALHYPHDKLDIWVLDDSPKGNILLAQDLVHYYANTGIPIHYAKRRSKRGGKAGNLAFGLTISSGKLICIFDADNTPAQDFLLETVPYFNEKRMGFIQTSMDYSNKDRSFLTRFQYMLARHKENVTKGQAEKKHFASLTGSSCVWRRSCIEDIGGVKCTTMSEDMDMCMRAHAKNWQYAFVAHVSSLAEFPESISVFRVQRERWGRGHIQNSFLHARKMLNINGKSFWVRFQALILLCASGLLASWYVIFIFALPIALMTENVDVIFHLCSTILFICISFAASSCIGRAVVITCKKNIILYTLSFTAMFFLLSLYYLHALIYVLIKGQGAFNPTAKGSMKTIAPKLSNRLLCLEILSFFYALTTLVASIIHVNFWTGLYSILSCTGFGLGLFLSWQEFRGKI